MTNSGMTHEEAQDFAQAWLAAWNSHDIDAVLSHFADDASFSSPIAAVMFPESGGILRGKQAIKEYWSAAIQHIPDLHFEILGVYAGINLVVINYRNHVGNLVNEVLALGPDGLVRSGAGTYIAADAARASGVRPA